MARLQGLFKTDDIRQISPYFAPPSRIDSDIPHHKEIDGISIRYRSKADKIRPLLPEFFSIEENPIVTVLVIKYGNSPVGPYNELIHYIEVEWKGKIYDYNFLLLVDNEDSIYSGREMFGFPKVSATFDLTMEPDGRTGFYHAAVRRPSSVSIVEVLFKAAREVKEPWKNLKQNKGLTIRVVPTPCGIDGGRPIVRQVVELGMKLSGGEVHEGVGSISFPIQSEFDPFYKFPVEEYLSCVLLRNVSATMDPIPVFYDF
ncbi:hypothetical protein NM208_g6545 [Fusarium decemcellulare]|uniref:Uncharacterized protein n=1 Tax=Fusarium decemcellulare TaxID=57161 RepID=A0ACC1SD13_9HYPO|nr:hypothetical protein NM208_g6545 [Fusarium decemcellulare]